MKLVKSTNGKHEAHPGESLMGLWNNFFSSPFSHGGLSQAWPDRPRIKAPVVDISEDDKEVAVKAEIAGVADKDLELSYLDGVLHIKGEKKEEKEEKPGKNTWYRESWQGSFTRNVPVGNNVDWSKAQARYKDGVLTVRIPKIASAKPDKIDIK